MLRHDSGGDKPLPYIIWREPSGEGFIPSQIEHRVRQHVDNERNVTPFINRQGNRLLTPGNLQYMEWGVFNLTLRVTLFVGFILLTLPLFAHAENKSGVEPRVLSLPTGPGSIKGLGESFEPDLNTGTAHYQVKIETYPGVAGFAPEISLSYDAGYGNGHVGLSWQLSIPSIQRQTEKGLPRYTSDDVFVYQGSGELVPIEQGFYRPKIEGDFMRFRPDGDGWMAWSKDGTKHEFGMSATSRISDASYGTFGWMIERSTDTHGNIIGYSYFKDGGDCYLQRIDYGSGAGVRSVLFDCEARSDVVTDGKARFPVTTSKRLKTISVLSQAQLVRRYELSYGTAQGTRLSLLTRVTQYGADGATALPSIAFQYSGFTPAAAQTVAMQNPPMVNIANGESDLLDLNGDGLPDLLYTPSSGHEVFLNLGHGIWDTQAKTPQVSPAHRLSVAGVFMGDLDGDGLSDLVVQNSTEFGFYRNSGNPWEKEADWVAYSAAPPFLLDDPGTRLVEINHDGLVDVVQTGLGVLSAYLNHSQTPWTEVVDASTLGLSLTNPQVQFADMNGDGLEDLVYLDADGAIYYHLCLGYGRFVAEESFMGGSPVLSYAKIADGTVLLMDVNGDGLSDLVQVDSSEITLWVNQGNNAFGTAVSIADTPSFLVGNPELRQADMGGDGCKDLLYSIYNAPENEAFQYVRFVTGTRPNLLTRVENGLGMVIDIGYQSSTEYALQARDAGNPWETVLPFPVTVVSQRRITDQLSGDAYASDYVYRDGYYDGKEREFRGFAQVEEIHRGDATAPTLKTIHVFDVGKTEESRKGMLLEQARLTENGTIAPASGLFDHAVHILETRTVATGLNDETVRFSFTARDDQHIYEGTATPKALRTTRNMDDYGNVTQESRYGQISGADMGFGGDEVITTTEYEYRVGEDQWMVDLVKRVTQRNLAGTLLSDTRNTYNPQGDLTLQEKFLSPATWVPVVRNEYDAFGNMIRMQDANNHTRTIGYDSVFHTFPDSELIEGLNLTMSASYDPVHGKPNRFVDPNGQETRFGYDALGRLTSIVQPGDSEALPTQGFVYHLGNPVSYVGTFAREVSGAIGAYDAYAFFDGLGRKLQTRSEAEGGQWLVQEAVSFNLRQGVKEKWLPFFAAGSSYEAPPGSNAKVQVQYDAAGRAVRETQPDGAYLLTQYLPLEQKKWDEEDTRSGGLHENTPARHLYDGLERLVQVEEKNGASTYTTQYAYDGLGNLTRLVDDQGNTKTMTYDTLGRKTHMDDPDKGTMDYVYDPAGNLIQTTDARGLTVEYAYDAANRTLTESHTGVTVRFHYDADHPSGISLSNTMGKLSWVEDESGKSWFSYDARGNVAKRGRRVLGYEFNTSMTYDALNRLTGITYPDGMAVAFQYNVGNLLEAIPGYVENIDYAPSGQKSRFEYANGIASDYAYDFRQRLSSIRTASPGLVLQDLSYTYDLTSNILGIQDGRDNPTPESRTQTLVYDDLYRLTRCTTPQYWVQYAYDSIGNLINKTSNVTDAKVNVGELSYGEGSAGPHAVTSAGAYVYTYDANGNLKTKTGQSFTFDHKDRMTGMTRDSDGLTAQYRYDHTGNRVWKAVKQGIHTETTIYVDNLTEVRDNRLIEHVFAGDRRVASVDKPFDAGAFMGDAPVLGEADLDANHDGSITVAEIRSHGDDPSLAENQEVRDGIKVFRENLLSNPSLLALDAMASAVHELNPGTAEDDSHTRFYLPDHLGSASIVTDEAGNVVEESVLYPYGMNRKRSGQYEEPYSFTGKELDEESDLHYFGARYYDAMVGRFVSVDPLLVEAIGVNGNEEYRFDDSSICGYGSNNPVGYLDLDGLVSARFENARDWWVEEFGGKNFTRNYLVYYKYYLNKTNSNKQARDLTRKRILSRFKDFLKENAYFVGNPKASHKFPEGYCTTYVASQIYVPWAGNAGTWLQSAKIIYEIGSKPKRGAILVTGPLSSTNPEGHVAIVERYDKKYVYVREMNVKGWNKESKGKYKIKDKRIKGYIYGNYE